MTLDETKSMKSNFIITFFDNNRKNQTVVQQKKKESDSSSTKKERIRHRRWTHLAAKRRPENGIQFYQWSNIGNLQQGMKFYHQVFLTIIERIRQQFNKKGKNRTLTVASPRRKEKTRKWNPLLRIGSPNSPNPEVSWADHTRRETRVPSVTIETESTTTSNNQ